MLTFKLERRGDKFAKLRQALPSKARVLLVKHVDATIDLMKQLSPVDTGAMRDSIDKVERAPLLIDIVVGVPYAIFVEFGTVNMEAQPFITPAIESGRRGLVADLKKALKEL
jgi:HK97 gp10 family phage protein